MYLDECKGFQFNEPLDKASIVGDFSVDLMRYDLHTPVNVFLNSLSSYDFFPCTFQSVRMRKSPNTLLDKKLLNCCF